MEHFTIYSEDHPAPTEPPLSLSERLQLDGNYIYVSKAGIPVLAEDNEPEAVAVWIAEPRRVATFDTVPEDVPFTINLGVYA